MCKAPAQSSMQQQHRWHYKWNLSGIKPVKLRKGS